MITLGRYPTLGEVCDYYCREDFLEFLLRAGATWKVVLVIPERKHWEPNWEEDRVRGRSRAELREFIRGRIADRFAGLTPDERLPFYPSFHQSLERWSPGAGEEGGTLGQDGVAEADWPTWRESFQDVLTLIDVLRKEGVPHHTKFSGHRSLHLLVPFSGDRLQAGRFGDSQAHGVKILRLPYSLNEDTGLVSLPLTWEELPTFRPWQANLHGVEIRPDWLAEPTPAEREHVQTFLAGLRQRPPVPRRAYFNPLDTLATQREQMGQRQDRGTGRAAGSSSPAGQAWRRLWGAEPVTAEDLRAALQSADPEVRWLTAEAFLLHGEALTPDLLPRLLAEEDAYMRPAALDVLLRFPDLVQDYFVAAMQAEDLGRQARSLHVLSQSEALRQKVVAALRAVPERTGALTLRLACVTGVVLGDWDGAWALVREAEPEHGNEPTWATRVEALRRMQDLTQQWWDDQHIPALTALGPEIVDLLLLAVGTRERRLRRAFLIVLSEWADERALEVFVEALGDHYRDTVKWATRGLVRLGPVAVPPLLEAAASDQARLRRYAIRCLGHLADPRAYETVLAALEDTDEGVCRQAVLAVPNFAARSLGTSAADVARLKQVAPRCGEEVLASLLTFGEAGRQAVMELALEEGDPHAARWLWQQGDERGRTLLLAALNGPPERRKVAIRLLAERPDDEQLVEVFIEGLSTISQWERGEIAQALVRLHHPKGLEALLDWSRSEVLQDRKGAAEALGQWDDPRSIEALVTLLNDPHRKVRPKAVAALVNLGESARPALVEAVSSHPSRGVRRLAATALRALDLRPRWEAGEALTVS